MARVQYGGGPVAFRGSIAGNTFFRNIASECVRNRVAATQPRTAKQMDPLTITNFLQAKWSDLDPSIPPLWNAFASVHTRTNPFGKVTKLTGQNWFISVNQNLMLCGLSWTATVPAWVIPPAPTDFYWGTSAGFFTAEFAPAPVPADTSFILYMSTFTRQKNTSPLSLFRFIKVLPPATPTHVIIDSDWMTAFNLPDPSTITMHATISTYLYAISHLTGLSSLGFFYTLYFENP